MGSAPHASGSSKAIAPKRGGIAREIFNQVFFAGDRGLTCYAVEMNLRLKHQTASARIRELVQAGCVKKAGERAGAAFYVAVKDADFSQYVEWTHEKRTPRISKEDKERVISAALDYVRTLKTAKGLDTIDARCDFLRIVHESLDSLV